MKITRRDALTLLNACFDPELVSIHLPSGQYFQSSFTDVRSDLFFALLARNNYYIWQYFRNDPVLFKEKYEQKSGLIINMGEPISMFFRNEFLPEYPSQSLLEISDSEKELMLMKDSLLTKDLIRFNDRGIAPTVRFFNKFWNICCDIAKIPEDIRNKFEFSNAKIDAFVYFNALSNYYGMNVRDMKADLMEARIEILTTYEGIFGKKGEKETSLEEFNKPILESRFFKCPIFKNIMKRFINSETCSSPQNKIWTRESIASMLYYPTNKIIKVITAATIFELSDAVKIINGDKDFWGNDWIEDITENEKILTVDIKTISENIIRETSMGIKNIFKDFAPFDKLPPIPAFEDAVKDGYFAEQDQEGHYRSIKSLSLCFDNNPKLIALSPKTLKEYIRKSDGNTYTGATIEGYLFRKKT